MGLPQHLMAFSLPRHAGSFSLAHLGRSLRSRAFFCFLLFLLASALAPGSASADEIGLIAELAYSHSTTKEATGTVKLDTKGDIFLQRYRLSLIRTLYPNLAFTASGLFEHTKLWSTANDGTVSEESTSTETKIIPTLGLSLNNPFVSAGATYTMFRDQTKSGDITFPADIRESYTASLGLRPEGFPELTAIYSRNHTYDEDRKTRDLVDESYLLSLRYRPRQELDLNYSGIYSDSEDRLTGLKTQTLTNSGRVSYTKQFFGRVSLSTSYNGSIRETKVVRPGQGTIESPVLAFAGLSGITDTPVQVVLDPNPALIDGDLVAGSGISIGQVPFGGNDKPRNIGLDFFNVSEVNTLYVWVDRALPPVVSNSFTWAIYTSSDNLNWSLYQTVAPAPFGSFENRFEIRFPSVKTRYIKVVVKPLSSGIIPPVGVDVSSIFVTELQAFLSVSAANFDQRTSDYSHLYALDVRTRILDNPSLIHTLSYWQSWAKQGGTTYTFSNALSLSKRLSRVFSTTARVELDKSASGDIKTTSYVSGVSLTAIPLDTLTHTLTASARIDKEQEGTNTSRSLYLTNSAELYRGVDLSLVGGLTNGSLFTGEETKGTTVAVALNLVPRENLSIEADYSINNSERTGGISADTKDDKRSLTVSVSNTPVSALYLFASVTRETETDKEPSTFQSYSASWSPFRGGTLQIGVSYTEELRSTDNGKVTSYGPNVRWNITPVTSLDLSYIVSTERSGTGVAGSEGPSQINSLDGKSFSAFFRTRF